MYKDDISTLIAFNALFKFNFRRDKNTSFVLLIDLEAANFRIEMFSCFIVERQVKRPENFLKWFFVKIKAERVLLNFNTRSLQSNQIEEHHKLFITNKLQTFGLHNLWAY